MTISAATPLRNTRSSAAPTAWRRSAASAGDRSVYALTLEYDGTDFSGWQKQPGRRTVEGTLLEAIAAVTGEQAMLTTAGRTDAGAHAHGQVVGCGLRRPWDPERLRLAVNAHLPEDVCVVTSEPAPAGFHARFDAIARTYRYVVAPRHDRRRAVGRQYAWTVRGPLNEDAMRRAARVLVGTHDFASFGRSPRPGGSTVRTVHAVEVRRLRAPEAAPLEDAAERGIVLIDVTADAFLYGMMRALAAVLVEVGMGVLDEAGVKARLTAADLSGAGRRTAPAHGLHQWHVRYPRADAASPTTTASDREGR